MKGKVVSRGSEGYQDFFPPVNPQVDAYSSPGGTEWLGSAERVTHKGIPGLIMDGGYEPLAKSVRMEDILKGDGVDRVFGKVAFFHLTHHEEGGMHISDIATVLPPTSEKPKEGTGYPEAAVLIGASGEISVILDENAQVFKNPGAPSRSFSGAGHAKVSKVYAVGKGSTEK